MDTDMTIRRKLLLLLLGTTLTPLIVISAFRQIAIRLTGQWLTNGTQETLVSNTGLQLQQLLESCTEVFAREAQLMDALVRRQAREAEFRLSRTPGDRPARLRDRRSCLRCAP